MCISRFQFSLCKSIYINAVGPSILGIRGVHVVEPLPVELSSVRQVKTLQIISHHLLVGEFVHLPQGFTLILIYISKELKPAIGTMQTKSLSLCQRCGGLLRALLNVILVISEALYIEQDITYILTMENKFCKLHIYNLWNMQLL